MKTFKDLRHTHKRNKSRRILENKFDESSMNDVFTHIRISGYTNKFGYDSYIESYMKRLEKK